MEQLNNKLHKFVHYLDNVFKMNVRWRGNASLRLFSVKLLRGCQWIFLLGVYTESSQRILILAHICSVLPNLL